MRSTCATIAIFLSACSALPAAGTAAARWTPVGLCGGGGLFNPAASPHDPKMMMVECDMGGRYISRDGGRHWRMIHRRQIGSAVRGAPVYFHPGRPGVIYALSGYSADTIYRTTDNGKTWAPLPDGRQPRAGLITRFYIDKDRPDRLFVGTADGNVAFTDGDRWQRAKGVSGRVIQFAVDRTAPVGKRPLFVGASAGVFRSDDGGGTFAKAVRGLPADRGLTGFAGGSDGKVTILYATTPCRVAGGKLTGGVYVSTDGAGTWKRAMNPKINVQTTGTSQWRPKIPRYTHIVANDADPRRAYAACDGTSYFPPNHATIYRTDDAGASWTETFFVDPRFKEFNADHDWMTSYRGTSWVAGPRHLEISPTDPDTVMRTDGMFLFFTRNAGKHWTAGHAVKAAGCADATDDAKITWANNGLVVTTTWNYYVDPHQPNRHYIAYTDIGFARSLDGGVTWRWWGPSKAKGEAHTFPVPRGWTNTCYELAFDPKTPGKIWGAFSGHHDIPNENSIWRGTGRSRFPGGVCVTEDFGVTWKPLRNGLPEKPALSVVLDPKSPLGKRTLYVSIYDSGVYKSTDGGATWARKSAGLGDPDNMRVCKLLLHADGTLFVLVTGMRVPANGPFTTKGVGLYRSRDGGDSWELVNKNYPLLYPKDYGVDPADSRVIFIGACDAPIGMDQRVRNRQGGLHRTTDGGATWKSVLRKRGTHFGATFHPSRKGWVYATSTGWADAPEGTMWLSTDGGETWKNFAGIPFGQTHRVHFDPTHPDVIYVTTFGGSVWKGPVEP